ncbi:hypothetical protein F5Y13DRAFT_196621 [Hypoxylon sp. FL1857]|nr:hypothetical protein F5Y13DRAFT_196621 [Hypoxylon sp. FL1857]
MAEPSNPTDEQVGTKVDEQANNQPARDTGNSIDTSTAVEPPANHGDNVTMIRDLDNTIDNPTNAIEGLTNQVNEPSARGTRATQEPVQQPVAPAISAADQLYRLQRAVERASKLKPIDIGYFEPIPQYVLAQFGRCRPWRGFFEEVQPFIKRIKSFLRDPTTKAIYEHKILSIFGELLRRGARGWWVEYTDNLYSTQRSLSDLGLIGVLKDLEATFCPKKPRSPLALGPYAHYLSKAELRQWMMRNPHAQAAYVDETVATPKVEHQQAEECKTAASPKVERRQAGKLAFLLCFKQRAGVTKVKGK